MSEPSETSEFICIEHNHSACPYCVEEFQKAEATAQKKIESLEKLVQEGLEREKKLQEYVQHERLCTEMASDCSCGLSDLLAKGGQR